MLFDAGRVGRQTVTKTHAMTDMGGYTSPSLDLVFDGRALDPRITFTRASTATYFDATGTMQTAATNAPRFDYDPVTYALRGLLIEEARTNVLLNTAALGTQGVAVTAQAYTLSFYGTGTVTMSGAFAGSLVGTGAFPARAQLAFTPAAGTLTCTVSGSVLNAQLEAGAFPTSYIPTTAATVTRAQDFCAMPLGAWYGTTAGTIVPEAMLPANGNVGYRGIFELDSGTPSPSIRAYTITATAAMSGNVDVATLNFGTITPGTPFKLGATYSAAGTAVALNGVMGTGTATVSATATYTTLRLGCADSGGANVANGYLRRVQYWPRVLSNAEMQSVTT